MIFMDIQSVMLCSLSMVAALKPTFSLLPLSPGFGGDEFVYVILLDEGKAAVAYNILTKVTLENLIVYNKHFTFDLASSGGVALFPEDGHTISELLTRRSCAIYDEKQQASANWFLSRC